MHSRRKFLTEAGIVAAGTLGSTVLKAVEKTSDWSAPETVSLCGQWWFRTDSGSVGVEQHWYGTDDSIGDWRRVHVPFTWQVDPAFANYRGIAWYRRTFDAASEWQNSATRIEFEAVFHTATIWVNGKLAGDHVRARATRRSRLISLISCAGASPTRSQCAWIVHSTTIWCPEDAPATGRMTEVSFGRFNCSLHRKLLWSALMSKPSPILPVVMESSPSPLFAEIQIRRRGWGKPPFELSTTRLD